MARPTPACFVCPRDTKLKDIQEIGVHFVSGHPSAFDTADNWNMQSITVRAGNDKGHVLVEKAGNPLWRSLAATNRIGNSPCGSDLTKGDKVKVTG